MPEVVRAIIETPSYHSRAMGLKAVVMGCDPCDPAGVWDRMYDATYMYGRRGAVIHAISAIDLALWDIRGKAEGKPVADLLGGTLRRPRIQAYGTVYPLGTEPDTIRRSLDSALGKGLRALKICAETDWRFNLDKAAAVLRETRAHIGPEIKLMLDAVGAWHSADEILPLMPLLQEVGLVWLEAPFPLENLDDHARITGLGTPIAGGDLGMTTRYEFAQMILQGKADIVQPDLSMAGGLTEVLKIADLARQHGRRVVPHGYKSNILNAANLGFLSQHWQEEMLEYSLSRSPLLAQATEETLDIQGDGTVLVPTAPGLGVTLNERALSCFCKRVW